LTGIDKIADINVNYCLPNQKEWMVADYTCPGDIVSFVKADSAFKQAACIAMFGMKLRQSGYASSISWKNIESIANSCFSKYDPLGNEYLLMVSKARKIYKHKKRRFL